nr:hypothetical protein [Tanacetum cinerariifolium]
MQDDLLNKIRNFMQNLHDGLLIPPPGVDKEHEATTDTELPCTEDIQPLPVQEPPQESDICKFIRKECCVEASEEQKQSMEDTMLELVKICQEKEFLCIHDDEDKNVIEQPAEREKLAPVLLTKEPEHLLSMRYEHLSISPEIESDEVTKSNAENLLPIPIYDDDFEDIEYVEASLPDPEIFSVEEEN